VSIISILVNKTLGALLCVADLSGPVIVSHMTCYICLESVHKDKINIMFMTYQ